MTNWRDIRVVKNDWRHLAKIVTIGCTCNHRTENFFLWGGANLQEKVVSASFKESGVHVHPADRARGILFEEIGEIGRSGRW